MINAVDAIELGPRGAGRTLQTTEGKGCLMHVTLWELVKVQGPDECWPWLGRTDKDGYARYDGPGQLVHRAIYITTHGPIPLGHDVDHTCFNRICENPNHMRSLPAAINRNLHRPRSEWKPRVRVQTTHCPSGHLRGDNTYVSARGDENCRPCNSASVQRYKVRKRSTP